MLTPNPLSFYSILKFFLTKLGILSCFYHKWSELEPLASMILVGFNPWLVKGVVDTNFAEGFGTDFINGEI